MRRITLLISTLAAGMIFWCGLSVAQQSDEEVADPGVELLQALQNPDVDFVDAYEKARAAGASETELLAGKTFFYLRSGNVEGLLNVNEELAAAADDMEYGPNRLFGAEAQLNGLVETLNAVEAYRQEDWEAFETAAKESFWQWPEWSTMFGINQMILERRSEEIRESRLADLVVPMETEVRQLDGSTVALNELVEGHKALLVDFWASWCGPCLRLMPELSAKSEQLAPQGIYVAALNTDDEEPLRKAAEVKEQREMDMPWLVEDENQTMSQLLMITSIPHMALIAPDGELLWSGHPMDEGLSTALAELGVSMEGK